LQSLSKSASATRAAAAGVPRIVDGCSPTAIHIRATPVISRVHQIDQPLAGRLLNGSLSGQISRSGETRASADVGGSPLSMSGGSIDSPRATRADCRSGLISRLPLLSASASRSVCYSGVKSLVPSQMNRASVQPNCRDWSSLSH